MNTQIYDFEYYYKKKKADNIAQSIVDTVNNSKPCNVIKIKKYFKEWLEVKTELTKRKLHNVSYRYSKI